MYKYLSGRLAAQLPLFQYYLNRDRLFQQARRIADATTGLHRGNWGEPWPLPAPAQQHALP
jgi:hypothetical protein